MQYEGVKKFCAMEFFGTGEPFFGGNANDRILCSGRVFLDEHRVGLDGEKLLFDTKDEAQKAGENAKNLRPGGLVSASESE